MEFFNRIEDLWQKFCQKTESGRKSFSSAMGKVGKVLKIIGGFLYKYRGILLSVPVIIFGIVIACINMSALPAMVGIDLQSNGEFSMTVARWIAVLVPFGITMFCALLTLGAKKTLYPWLISLFSLVLPLLIYVSNVYPA